MYVEVFCNELANRFVCSAIYRRGLDIDLVTSVGKWRNAFPLTACVYLDVYSHGAS